jgi:hypothetical protein
LPAKFILPAPTWTCAASALFGATTFPRNPSFTRHLQRCRFQFLRNLTTRPLTIFTAHERQRSITMDRIPSEILFSILECVAAAGSHRISRYASICRQWQTAVECVTFRSLTLSPSDLDAFQEAFRGVKVWRRGELRSLKVQPLFPEIESSDEDSDSSYECCQVTQVVNRDADSKVWSPG